MKIAYIVSPVAGKKKAVRWIPGIKEATMASGHEASVCITDGPGDAAEKAARAVREGCDVIVAVGGDGTVNEVVNGIGDSGAVLGIIPAGSGNDFARTLRIPLNYEGALDCILQGRTKLIDVGMVNGKRFINIVSIGFDAQVVMETNSIKRKIRGPLVYVLGVFKALINYEAFDIDFETEDKRVKKKAVLMAIANGVFYGGGMKMAPNAKVDDGLFDVCFVRHISRLKILKLFPLIYSGGHLSRPEVEHFRTAKIHIKCSRGHINSDGEIIGPCPADMILKPGGLSVMVP